MFNRLKLITANWLKYTYVLLQNCAFIWKRAWSSYVWVGNRASLREKGEIKTAQCIEEREKPVK